MKILINILIIGILSSCDNLRRDNSTNQNFTHQKYYYETGELLSQGFKKDSLFVGTWIMYRENGQIRAIKSYGMNGKPDGVWQYFYPNGFINEFKTFKNDTIDGTYISYTSKGELIDKYVWYNGTFNGDYEIHNGDKLCQDDSYSHINDSTGKLISVRTCVDCRWVTREPKLSEIENSIK